MIRYRSGAQLAHNPRLRHDMHRDRTRQFHDRLGWRVHVDATGCEVDQYDLADTLYVLCLSRAGHHLGSLRLMPTCGPTMINDHFAALLPAGPVHQPDTWECTRFCVAPDAPEWVAAALLLGGLEAGLALGAGRILGVFALPMLRIYGRLGWPPVELGREGRGRSGLATGAWLVTPDRRQPLAEKSGLDWPTVADAARELQARALLVA